MSLPAVMRAGGVNAWATQPECGFNADVQQCNWCMPMQAGFDNSPRDISCTPFAAAGTQDSATQLCAATLGAQEAVQHSRKHADDIKPLGEQCAVTLGTIKPPRIARCACAWRERST